MKFDVKFINFPNLPKSEQVREIVAGRITDCVGKFVDKACSVRAFFSKEGISHQVKIDVKAGKLATVVSAKAQDVAHSVDGALRKLESALRHVVSRNRHKKVEFSQVKSDSPLSVPVVRHRKRRTETRSEQHSGDDVVEE